MIGLQARFVEYVPSPDGTQADVLLIEPNGDQYRVRCLCRSNGLTEIGGDPEAMTYLDKRYGDRAIWGAARSAMLA